MLATVALLSTSDAAAKWLAPHYPVVQIVFVRAALGLLPAFLLVQWQGERGSLVTQRVLAHLLRTALMLAAWGLFIMAIRFLPLADAYTVVFGAPLFMTLLGRVLLGERVPRTRWLAVSVGFVGVLIVLHPSGLGFGRPVLAALGAAGAWAFSTIASRRLSQTEPSTTILFYYMLLSLVATAPFAVRAWAPVAFEHLPIFLLTGVVGAAAHWLMAQAFRYGEVSLLAPFEYTGLVWALSLGYWLWGDVPTPAVLVGASLIIASGIYMVRQEGERARRPVQAPAQAEPERGVPNREADPGGMRHAGRSVTL